ncbi:MAG TPA: hypothetical protein VFG83_13060 [Kofleriaceae bacterium]|nr:hypothetical protein [Kofleriaceae bacterium]
MNALPKQGWRGRLVLAGLLAAMVSCGPGASETPGDGVTDAGGVDAPLPPLTDTDNDGIADDHEGAGTMVDTDGDGTPDYQDEDSDADGVSDADESGDGDPQTTPPDSDGDSVPDFQDTDSDQNGRPDGIDGTGDLDGDGTGDFADGDDDGDGLSDASEIGPDAQNPIDSDSDATPDFQDLDSDGDDISDKDEGSADPDMDDVPAVLDDDSDGDGLGDVVEGGDDSVTTHPFDTDSDGTADFLDFDSDNDGLRDGDEDKNGNGMVDAGETSPTRGDSDGDGADDLVETAAGTDPTNSADNPQANGDFVFVVPYQKGPTPDKDDLDFSTDLKKVDLYVLIDRSGSMSSEIDSVVDNLSTVLGNLTCPPLGNGTVGNCIPDLFSGSGTIGYETREPYTNHVSIQDDPDVPGPAIDTTDPGGFNGKEPILAALWGTVTGKSSSSLNSTYDCDVQSFPAHSCSGKTGAACFRPGALPVILLATDEPPISSGDTYKCPGKTIALDAANDIGAKIIGILGNTSDGDVEDDLAELAKGTGVVDSSGNGLVFEGADANAAGAIEDAVRTLADNVPLDVAATSVDDPGDTVDAVAAFVDHLETLQLGTAACSDGLSDTDTNGDTFKDEYLDVKPGTPVCWRLFPKMNTTVKALPTPQLFEATVVVKGDGVTDLDTREVFFLVPPDLSKPDPE